MKKLILIALFSIGIIGMNAHECHCDGPSRTHVIYAVPKGSTTPVWYGTIRYTAPDDHTACITSIISNPDVYWGDIPMNILLTNLMSSKKIREVMIPTSCYTPVVTKIPSAEGMKSIYSFTPCSDRCCIIDPSNVNTIFGVGGPRPGCDPGCYTICD